VNLLTLTTFQAGVIGLGLNYGAYMTEIFRAGIQSVGHGQAEAADALGMTYTQRMRRVVLPQAIRVIIPPTGNEFIAMMKDTALVGFLGASVASAGCSCARSSRSAHPQPASRCSSRRLYWLLTSVFTFFRFAWRSGAKGYVPRGEGGPGRQAHAVPPVAAGKGRKSGDAAPPEEGTVTTDAVVRWNLHPVLRMRSRC
jgi:polar amino acid transport system permease protein